MRRDVQTCASLVCALAALSACGGTTAERYPLRAPLWVDPDRRPFSPAPEEAFIPWMGDAVDNTVFRPLAELFLYEESRPAINVNSVDEVPSSSWFENRVGRLPLTPARVADGACGPLARAPEPPWTVVAPKSQGSTSGMFVEDASGRRYIFKIDLYQPERNTAADAIATRLFWAIGYHTPCNWVVTYTPDDFRIADGVPRTPEDDTPMRRADLQEIFDRATRTPDGRWRGSLSLLVDGEPLGGWRFDGTRDDDPNDVVPHEHRREARGMYVLSSWLDHVDSRAENNLDAWISVGDGSRGYVRHYVLDVGGSLGIIWPTSTALSRRLGNSHYVDLEHMLGDLVSLGFADRAYNRVRPDQPHRNFGYFDVERFEPNQWRNGYPNPAFERRTEHDAAWMARIISRLGAAHLRAAIATGHFARPSEERELLAILLGRRRRILERYLTRLSPLSFPQVLEPGSADSEDAAADGADAEGAAVEGALLCMRDLAVESGLRAAADRRYRANIWLAWPSVASRRPLNIAAEAGVACVALPAGETPSEGQPRYLVVDVVAATEGRETTGAAQVHLYRTARGHRVVGLRRLEPD